jgi:uncharacterized protein YabE (DUF348 family)
MLQKFCSLALITLILTSCQAVPSVSTKQSPITITYILDGQPSQTQTTATTVREFLDGQNLALYSADIIAPEPSTPLADSSTIRITRSKPVKVKVDDKTYTGRSAQSEPAQILRELGFAPTGIDIIEVKENDTIVLHRVSEVMEFTSQALPYKVEYERSDALAAGEQKVLQAGVPGLSLGRKRQAFMDGEVIRTLTQPQTKVSEPVNQLVQVSTSMAIGTIEIGNKKVNYWKAVEMYTTSYSPCGSGTATCSYGTASGMKVAYGVVAVIPSLFNALAGTQVYIPGYGIGVIGDVGGGFPDGRPWIDLGYSDADYQGWYGFHTVYFLGDAPAYDPFGY